MFKFSSRSLHTLRNTTIEVQMLTRLALSRSPIDFGIPESGGRRSPQEQNKLYLQGLTKLDGYNKISYHQTGKAVDVFAFINGKVSYESHHLSIIAGVFYACANELGYKIRWGGEFGSDNFEGWDMPHFEIGL